MVNKKIILILFLNFLSLGNFAEATKIKVASINLCADQYIFLIADKKQITSLSFMSNDENISYIFNQISNIKLNNGRAEDIIAQDPDLIFTGPGSSFTTINLLKKLNYKVISIPEANSFEEIKSQILFISKLLDKENKGNYLVKKIDEEINKYKNFKYNHRNKSIIAIGPNGYVRSDKSLLGSIFNLLGYDNVINRIKINNYSRVSLEDILILDPQIIISLDSYSEHMSLSQNFLRHPVLEHIRDKGVSYSLDRKLLSCAGPFSGQIFKNIIMQNGN